MEKAKLNINPQHIVCVDLIDSQESGQYQWLIDRRSKLTRIWQAMLSRDLIKDQSGFYKILQAVRVKMSKQQVIDLEKDTKFWIEDYKVFLRPRVVLSMVDGSQVELYFENLIEAENYVVRCREMANLIRLSAKDEFTTIKTINYNKNTLWQS